MFLFSNLVYKRKPNTLKHLKKINAICTFIVKNHFLARFFKMSNLAE